MKLQNTTFLLFVSLLLSAQFAFAQKVSQPRPGTTGDWRLLGTTQAKHSADHDAIIVAGQAGTGRRPGSGF